MVDADLRGAKLAGADLVGANLGDADLTSVNLTSTNLTDIDLTEATLHRAHLDGANLDGAILPQLDYITALRWSSATQWGRDTVEIQARSVEWGDGVYVLNPATGQQAGALLDH